MSCEEADLVRVGVQSFPIPTLVRDAELLLLGRDEPPRPPLLAARLPRGNGLPEAGVLVQAGLVLVRGDGINNNAGIIRRRYVTMEFKSQSIKLLDRSYCLEGDRAQNPRSG